MVAKNIWLIFISFVLLTSCQTLPPEVSPHIERNQPRDIDMAVHVDRETQKAFNSVDTIQEIEQNEITSKDVDQPVSTQDVVSRLQLDALQFQSEGRWRDAELKLERAMRIDAEKVGLYHQLAIVRMGQQGYDEAEQIAMKGLSLTNQTPENKASLWEVIAQCRSAQGDIDGAREARSEMNKWRGAS